MSRIGRKPIAVPAGVDVKIDGTTVTVKGPKGTLTKSFHKDMIIKLEGNELIVERPSEDKLHKSLHGLTRTLINNMVVGVTTGFSKALEIVGTGYKAQMQGKNLVLNLGYSHPVEMAPREGIEFEVPAPTKVIVKGINKQVVGQTAAEVREVRKPEPYKGKGVRYEGEHVRRKEGKTGK